MQSAVHAKKTDSHSGKVWYKVYTGDTAVWLPLADIAADPDLADLVELFEHSAPPETILSPTSESSFAKMLEEHQKSRIKTELELLQNQYDQKVLFKSKNDVDGASDSSAVGKKFSDSDEDSSFLSERLVKLQQRRSLSQSDFENDEKSESEVESSVESPMMGEKSESDDEVVSHPTRIFKRRKIVSTETESSTEPDSKTIKRVHRSSKRLKHIESTQPKSIDPDGFNSESNIDVTGSEIHSNITYKPSTRSSKRLKSAKNRSGSDSESAESAGMESFIVQTESELESINGKVTTRTSKRLNLTKSASTTSDVYEVDGVESDSDSSANTGSVNEDSEVESDTKSIFRVKPKAKKNYKVRITPKKQKVSFNSHNSKCEKCGKGKRGRKTDDLEGDLGKLNPCDYCSSSYHENCLPKFKSSDFGYRCSSCRKHIPECDVCLVNLDDGESMFRCERCDIVVHWGCLEKEFSDWYEVPLSEIHEGDRGSREWFSKNFNCLSCDLWNNDIEQILTYRDNEAEDAPESDSREYFVKFIDKSYRNCAWVPAKWVNRLKREKIKVRNFWKIVAEQSHLQASSGDRPLWPKPQEETFNQEYSKVDRILEEEYRGRKHWVYVKWRELQYDLCTWELMPDEDEDDYQYFVEGLIRLESFQDVIENHREYLDRGCKKKKKFKELKVQPDCIVNGELKEYQLDGLNWLIFKWTHNTSVVLADEMGLGKTVQMVSFVNCLYHLHNHAMPFLIIAPTSTLGHWYNEFRKWAPKLNVVHYTGNATARAIIRDKEIFPTKKSDKQAGLLRCHVVLTSYDCMLSDATYFRNTVFEVVCADEGHRLKNDASKTFGILAGKVRARQRVLLTGTPLQNNIRELFNLMNYLDPKKFENQSEWEEKFAVMTEDNIGNLHETLSNYFLRRTKAVVLKDMPTKVELLVPVSLTPLQKRLYKALLAKNFAALRLNISSTESYSSKVTTLQNVLMQLRKICNHPYLLPDVEAPGLSPEEAHNQLVQSSGKLMLLQLMLRRLKERGHRVLIFSQFKIALTILEDFLTGEGYLYCRMDGDTAASSRQKAIDDFNAPDSPYFVFLLTTRTGGLGINLVTADTVIIYDADWNPHQDLQATARAHRIGQTKDVAVFKLFTNQCVEERIIEIGKNKMVLDHLVVESMEAGASLDKEEVASIIRFGATALFEDEGNEGASKVYKYDMESVDKLLDNRNIIVSETEEHTKQSTFGNFSFAKVWNTTAETEVDEEEEEEVVPTEIVQPSIMELDTVGEESQAEAPTVNDPERPEDDNQSFWDSLKDKITPLLEKPSPSKKAARESEIVTSRLRQRAAVNYSKFDEIQKKKKKDGNDSDSSEYQDDDGSRSSRESSPILVENEEVTELTKKADATTKPPKKRSQWKPLDKRSFQHHVNAQQALQAIGNRQQLPVGYLQQFPTPTVFLPQPLMSSGHFQQVPKQVGDLQQPGAFQLQGNAGQAGHVNQPHSIWIPPPELCHKWALCWICLEAPIHPVSRCRMRKNVPYLVTRLLQLKEWYATHSYSKCEDAERYKTTILNTLLSSAGYVSSTAQSTGSSRTTFVGGQLLQSQGQFQTSQPMTSIVNNQPATFNQLAASPSKHSSSMQAHPSLVHAQQPAYVSVAGLPSKSGQFAVSSSNLPPPNTAPNSVQNKSQPPVSTYPSLISTDPRFTKAAQMNFFSTTAGKITPNQQRTLPNNINFPLSDFSSSSSTTTSASVSAQPSGLISQNQTSKEHLSEVLQNRIAIKESSKNLPPSNTSICLLCDQNHFYQKCPLVRDEINGSEAVKVRVNDGRISVLKGKELMNFIQFNSRNRINRSGTQPMEATNPDVVGREQNFPPLRHQNKAMSTGKRTQYAKKSIGLAQSFHTGSEFQLPIPTNQVVSNQSLPVQYPPPANFMAGLSTPNYNFQQNPMSRTSHVNYPVNTHMNTAVSQPFPQHLPHPIQQNSLPSQYANGLFPTQQAVTNASQMQYVSPLQPALTAQPTPQLNNTAYNVEHGSRTQNTANSYPGRTHIHQPNKNVHNFDKVTSGTQNTSGRLPQVANQIPLPTNQSSKFAGEAKTVSVPNTKSQELSNNEASKSMHTSTTSDVVDLTNEDDECTQKERSNGGVVCRINQNQVASSNT